MEYFFRLQVREAILEGLIEEETRRERQKQQAIERQQKNKDQSPEASDSTSEV